ncbi:WD40 repeat domain-containing protein [Nostoc sp. CCY0012]|uniref:WD40 repeat domain-containing protein n=1 Tax=Nostoc sp. CCY0012 TaxID=1056123 RepID=UPI0039C6B830
MLYQGVEGFVYWLRSRPEPMVVLVVDQFEELFTLAPSEDRQRFLDLLLGAIKYAADKFKLVLTVRADFIAACLEIPALAQLLQESSVLVPPKLSDEDYRRVMLNPAEQVGLKVEPGLVEVLLQELNHSAGDLPLLEFVLEQLWEFRQAGELTLAAHKQQIGGIKGALERKAQEVYDSLDSPAQECARWIFLSLTQLGEGTEDTRRRVLKSELVVQKYPKALVERTLVTLTAAKLIVVNLEDEAVVEGSKGEQVDSITASGAVTIEVAHEILIRHWSTLRWWLEENRSRLRSQRQIEQSAALWQHNQQQSDFLLQGNRLAEAEEIFVKYTDELSADVQYFISACLAAREHQQREQKKRLRQAQIAVTVISVLGIAASGFGGLAYFQKQAAQLREIAALNASSQAFLLSHQQLEAVIASVKAGREIQQVFSPSPEIKLSTAATFQQAIYQTQEINRLPAHNQQVNAVIFSPDGKILASASDDKTIKLWHHNGSLITTISGNKSRVTAIAFSPDGKLLAATDADNYIKIYDIHGQLIKIFTGHNDIVTDVSFSADSKILASASLDNTVKIWQTDGRLINSWKAHDGWVNTVSFSPDGKIIASGGEDNLVKLWQVDDGNLITVLRGHQGRITRVQFSPDNQVLASGSGDKTIKIWNNQGEVLQNIEAHSEQINSIKFSPDNQILASASGDKTIKIWQLNGNLLKTIQGHGEAVRDISFSIDGQIIASAGADHTIKLWQLKQDKQVQVNDIRSISFSPDGKTFASASWNGDIKIWQKNASLVKEFSAHNDIADAVIFSLDGKTLATASADKTIKIWDSNNQQLIKILTGHEDRVTSISFSHDGNLLASGSADKTVKLWQVNNGKLLHSFIGHTDEVTSINFSSDANLLASGSVDNTVKLWDVNGNLVKNLTNHTLAIASVKFSPDSKLLATASWDNTIKLWRVADGKLIHTLTGHTDGVTSLSFNGQTLASGSADNTIKLWSIQDGTLLKTLLGHSGKVNSVSFSPDGKALVSGSDDAGVMVWNLDLDDLMQQGCDRIANYLQHNANVSPGDRLICRK